MTESTWRTNIQPQATMQIPSIAGTDMNQASFPEFNNQGSNMDAYLLGANMFGTVLQAFGSYQESEAKAAALEYNAQVAEADARQVDKSKEHELHKSKTVQRRVLAKQIATAAASGRQMSGSPLDVMARTESEALTDQEIIRSNAASAQGRLYSQSANDKGRASSVKSQGRSRALSKLLLGGGSSYAKSNYFKKKKVGE